MLGGWSDFIPHHDGDAEVAVHGVGGAVKDALRHHVGGGREDKPRRREARVDGPPVYSNVGKRANGGRGGSNWPPPKLPLSESIKASQIICTAA